MVVLHGSKGVIKKKGASPRINEVGLDSDILSLVNNTRDNKSNGKFHQQHKNKQIRLMMKIYLQLSCPYRWLMRCL
jgi:hypothetical protein